MFSNIFSSLLPLFFVIAPPIKHRPQNYPPRLGNVQLAEQYYSNIGSEVSAIPSRAALTRFGSGIEVCARVYVYMVYVAIIAYYIWVVK
jgi:hypothetical protein